MIKNNKKGVMKAKNSGLGSGGGSQHLSKDLSSYIHLIAIKNSIWLFTKLIQLNIRLYYLYLGFCLKRRTACLLLYFSVI